jgi:Asp-tRNA(Asn)/Glu-tRNA(Gln) amidotransferase A subunit family amidase
MNRRTLLEISPAIAAVLAETVAGQTTPASEAISREEIRQALSLIGLDFKPHQLDQMRNNVARALRSYTALRSVEIPTETAPPFYFNPLLPGMSLPKAAAFVSPPLIPPKRYRSIEDVAYGTLPEIAALIRTRRITSAALTRMYLDRLRRHGDSLHCVITLAEDLAIEQANRADAELAAGRYRGILHGIPYGAKDLFATKSIRTTWGAEPYINQVFDYNATVIDRLEEAGAVLAAKLSLSSLAFGGRQLGGMTRNPWKVERSAGGSSNGSAAATAAGLVAFSIGTETLGSLLTPSRICGVTGLRPTFGRVSRYGAMSLSWTMDKVGPICRSVEDCMLVLRAIAGPDNKDFSVQPATLAWSRSRPMSSLRLGVVDSEFQKLEGDRKAITSDALDVLKNAGARLEPVEVPKPLDLGLIELAEMSASFDEITRNGGLEKLIAQGQSDPPNTFRAGRLIPAVEYLRAQRARVVAMRQIQAMMADYDVIVTPSSSSFQGTTNFTGHPAITVPCGFVNGLPESIHFTGRLFEEGVMARAAKVFQDATHWHREKPPQFE